MASQDMIDELARRGQQIYDQRLRAKLEKTHHGEFLAIEPDSGDYFLGRSLDDAINACREAHPDRLCYGMRIGYSAAIEIGNSFE